MPSARRKHAHAQTEVVIPEKIYFRIGEVSELATLPAYVLRFWETEFSHLRPIKSSTGQRMYRRKDVEYVMQIRKLLYEDGFTIAGARERLREELRQSRAPRPQPAPVAAQPEMVAARPATERTQPAFELHDGAQTALPFPPSADAASHAAPERTDPQDELRRVRRQLSEVLALLS